VKLSVVLSDFAVHGCVIVLSLCTSRYIDVQFKQVVIEHCSAGVNCLPMHLSQCLKEDEAVPSHISGNVQFDHFLNNPISPGKWLYQQCV